MGKSKDSNSSGSNNLYKLARIKVLWVGEEFPLEPEIYQGIELIQMEDAYLSLKHDSNIDLVLINADTFPIHEIKHHLIEPFRDRRKSLPVVTFSEKSSEIGMIMMQEGATWHINKSIVNSPELLADHIRKHIFKPINWANIFNRYEVDEQPFLLLGLEYDKFKMNNEERYILKRLFRHNRQIHIFPLEAILEPGMSGAKVYRVQADDESMRIVKIETLSGLSTIEEKYHRLIRPRLSQYIGRMESNLVRAEHLGGASYILAGADDTQEVISLGTFLLDKSKVKRDIIDNLLEQLYKFLKQLYSSTTEVREERFWAEYYTPILPPELIVSEAELLEKVAETADIYLSSHDLTTYGSLYSTQQALRKRLEDGGQFSIILDDFEIVKFNPLQGSFHVQDDVAFKQKTLSSAILSKDLPILRFKVNLKDAHRKLLSSDRILRNEKKVSIKGIVNSRESQIATIRDSIERTLPQLSAKEEFSEHKDYFVQLLNTWFIDPIECATLLSWEVGREDFIKPSPEFSLVIHGDLNLRNILVAMDDEPKVWLIDFADARYGHIYFDLARLEVLFRANVFYGIFSELYKEKIWSEDVAIRATMLIEHLLLFGEFKEPDDFINALSNYRLDETSEEGYDWYKRARDHFVMYWDKMLYFLIKIRLLARRFGKIESFNAHYPVALFFQSYGALKFANLDKEPYAPWSKRLALILCLVSGTKAIKEVRGRATIIKHLVKQLKRVVANAVVMRFEDGRYEYLLHFSKDWDKLHLIGGEMKYGEDKDASMTLRREIKEELQLELKEHYTIIKELSTIEITQFSEKDFAFQDYEFYMFKVEFTDAALKKNNLVDLYWANIDEISNLETKNDPRGKRLISETTRQLFQKLKLL